MVTIRAVALLLLTFPHAWETWSVSDPADVSLALAPLRYFCGYRGLWGRHMRTNTDGDSAGSEIREHSQWHCNGCAPVSSPG